MKMVKLLIGDNRIKLKELPSNGIDSIVTDPPYELGFMGKSWDASGIAYDVSLWKECLRVLKPGGHMVAFSGSRTYHRMACAIEDAGFQIRDQIMWVYGSGFPKSLDISKAIDKSKGEMIETTFKPNFKNQIFGSGMGGGVTDKSWRPTTPEAQEWQGWGTALKPAHEPIVLARKPLSEKTVADNVLKWGTGGINIDGCRVKGNAPPRRVGEARNNAVYGKDRRPINGSGYERFPANFIWDGSQQVMDLFPETKHAKPSNGDGEKLDDNGGTAGRFFYCAKASKADRDDGLMRMPETTSDGQEIPLRKNFHPTVKPCNLMRYLCKLITPPAGIVLDPFTGSGSTGKAAVLEGFDFIGCELSEEYAKIAKGRIANAQQ